MRRIFYLVLLVGVVFAWRDWSGRPIVHPPGILVHQAPAQSAADDAGPFEFKGFALTRRASFDTWARVLSREDYRWGDEAELAPMDLALGWGVMSDQAVLDRIEISQGGRWYFTRYDLPAPLPDEQIIWNSSNMHMVPADKLVLKKLKEIRHGDVLRARGYLVDVDHENGFHWRTSLSRTDSGKGACEIFYIERLDIQPRN